MKRNRDGMKLKQVAERGDLERGSWPGWGRVSVEGKLRKEGGAQF